MVFLKTNSAISVTGIIQKLPNITYYIVTDVVSITTLLLGIKHILCPELNITLLRDLCPAHLSKIMTEGSGDISITFLMCFSVFSR